MSTTEKTLDHHGCCPECGANWDGGSIFNILRTQDWCRDKCDDELRTYVEESYSPPYRFSRLIGVELSPGHPRHYDGVSFWRCPDCNHEWSRFYEPSAVSRRR